MHVCSMQGDIEKIVENTILTVKALKNITKSIHKAPDVFNLVNIV